jgi:hypothetical protein
MQYVEKMLREGVGVLTGDAGIYSQSQEEK